MPRILLLPPGRRLGALLERARHDVAVPGSADREAVLAGYSGTPLPKKLGIRPESATILLGAPEGFPELLGPLPRGARLARRGRGAVVVLFARWRRDLERRLAAGLRALSEGGRLWIAWPKKASGVATDLAEPAIRERGLRAGLVDYKVCAIDGTWSGLCFARRRRAG